MPGARRRLVGVGGALLAALAAACGSPASDGASGAGAGDTVAAATAVGESSPDSIAALGEGTPASNDPASYASDLRDPFAVFGLSRPSVVDTTMKAIAVRIVNAGADALIIRADGGAGYVTIDTLAAGDSTRVRLETRAESLRVLATDAVGGERGVRWLKPDSLEARAVFP